MPRLQLASHLTLEELAQRARHCPDPVERRHWQMLWLLARGLPTAEVARRTDSSTRWVQEIARRYRRGPEAIGDGRLANPGAPPLLNSEQQAVLRRVLCGPAPQGGSWTGRSVAAWMTALLGRPVSVQRGWEWRHRLILMPHQPRRRQRRAVAATQAVPTEGVPRLR